MFAVSFDLVVEELEKHYGKPYHKAYYEIRKIMESNGFEWIQGSTYITQSDDMAKLFALMQQLSKIPWLKKSVRDIRGYRIENWSNFTDLVKEL